MTAPSSPFCYQRLVEFRDTDAAGIVHFSAFFPMMEAAEHALLRHLGLSVMQPSEGSSHITWPRVSAHCDYQGAAKFEDLLEIRPAVAHLGNKSVRYQFEIRCDGRQIASGQFAVVCCLWSPGQPLKSIPIPDPIRSLLATQLIARPPSEG